MKNNQNKHPSLIFLLSFGFSSMLVGQVANSATFNIYGVAHLSMDSVDDGDDSSVYITSSTSLLGFKGGHELKEYGMKAFFKFETGIDPTSQGANDGNSPLKQPSTGQIITKGRPSYVGIRGNFGTALLGNMIGLRQWLNDFNMFVAQVGDLGNLWEAGGIPVRVNNVYFYKSPKLGNGDVALTYVPEEGVDDRDIAFLKGNFATGKLKASAALASVGKGVGKRYHKAQALIVSYDLGRGAIGGGWQGESDIGGISGNDRDSYYIAGKVKVSGKGIVKAQVGISEGTGADTDASMFALGYDFIMDKQTRLYVAFAQMDNDPNIQFSVNGKAHGDQVVPGLGKTQSAVSFGMVYKFNVSVMK